MQDAVGSSWGRSREFIRRGQTPQEVSCDSTADFNVGTFSTSFNLRGMVGSSFIFQASYGGQEVESSPVSNAVIPLSLDSKALPALTLANASSYEVSGDCDSSVRSPVTVGIKDLSAITPKDVFCSYFRYIIPLVCPLI